MVLKQLNQKMLNNCTIWARA